MIRSITVFIFCFCLLTNTLLSQEQKSTSIKKTKSSAVIDGVKYFLHTVEKGQTLFAIAKLYKKDINEIVIENPNAIDGIKPGEILRIPVESKPEVLGDTSNCIMHAVAKGETMYAITKKYNTTSERLKALNPELKEGLKAGQNLKVPSPYPKIIQPKQEEKTQENADSFVYKGELKNEYNIALFLPFNININNPVDADRIINGLDELSNKTTIALQFYEGAKLAIDSLKKLKLNANFFVYDVDDKDSANLQNILKKQELSKMNLIIGPLYGSSFMPVAKYAKEHSIPIVSPFTQMNKIVVNNNYVCKVTPSANLQIEDMALFVTDSFKTQNIIAVCTQNSKDNPSFYLFKKTANDALLKAGYAVSDSIKPIYNVNALSTVLREDKLNVIVLPSNNQSYVSDFFSKLKVLNDNKYRIVVFGMQSWITYDNMDYDYFNELEIHVPTTTYIDYDKKSTKKFIADYREYYKTEPDIYSFQGYDVTLYFLSALQKYGTGFLNQLPNYHQQGIAINFLFSKFPSDSGFENKAVQMLKYKNYQLIKAN